MKVFLFESYYHRYMGVIADNGLLRFEVNPILDEPTVGEVYLGRIQHHIPSQNTYFVDIGCKRSAYLQGNDIAAQYIGLRVGDPVILQIKQEAHGQKGPKATTKLSLQGEGVVLLTDDRRFHASTKIGDGAWVKDMLLQIRSEIGALQLGLTQEPPSFGMILRTDAYSLKLECCHIVEEWRAMAQLLESWHFGALHKYLRFQPKKLFQPVQGWQRQVRQWCAGPGVLVTNLSQEALGILALPKDVAVHQRLDGFEALMIHEHIGALLGRKVVTEKGCEIVIDSLEALTAIDVNAAGFKGQFDTNEAAIVEINKEIIETLIAQIALRDISGMILIDFVKMHAEGQQNVLTAFKQGLKRYEGAFDERLDIDVKGFTRLGILELVRKRRQPSVLEVLATESSLRGIRERSVEYLVDRCLMELMAMRFECDFFLITASQEVMARLLVLKGRGALKSFLGDYMPPIYGVQTAYPLNSLQLTPLGSEEFDMSVKEAARKGVDLIRLL